MQEALNVIFSMTFLVAVLRVATPLILPALGGLISELGGVGNIALEGLMLAAACAGALISAYTKSVWLGCIAGLATATALAALLAFFHLDLKGDLVLSAVALNILSSGATIFVVYLLTKSKSDTSALVSGQMPFLSDWIPAIKNVPVVGPVLNQNILTYGALLLTGLVATFLYRTPPVKVSFVFSRSTLWSEVNSVEVSVTFCSGARSSWVCTNPDPVFVSPRTS